MKKYFMFFAACLTAAFVLTSCSDSTEDIPDSLVKTTFTTAQGNNEMKSIVSFVDEKNAILKSEVTKKLLNGKDMVIAHVIRATYVAKNGTGELHVDKVNSIVGESVTSQTVDLKLPMVYNLKEKTMTVNDVPLVMTDFTAMEWSEAPLRGAGTLPTLDDLQGAWYGMANTGKEYISVSLEVKGDDFASLYMMYSSGNTERYEGTMTYVDGTLHLGNYKIEMPTMDKDNFMTDVKVYKNDVLFCNIVGFMKDWTV